MAARSSCQAHTASTLPVTSVPSQIQTETPDSLSVASAVTGNGTNTGTVAPGTVLRHMMSTGSACPPAPEPATGSDSITVNGTIYHRSANLHRVTFRVNHSAPAPTVPGSLVDGGANGGLLNPADACILEMDLFFTADVVGITQDVLSALPIVQAAARIETVHDGPIIGIFSHYAQRSNGGCTIHSKGQLQSFGLLVDDTAVSVGGSQSIVTNEGYVIPLHVHDGLPYFDMTYPTETDMDTLPHVFFTADAPWDPSSLDGEYPDDPDAALPHAATSRRETQDSRVNSTGWITVSSSAIALANHTSLVNSVAHACSHIAPSMFLVSASCLAAFPQQLSPLPS